MSDSIDPTITPDETIGEIDFDGDGRNEAFAEDRDGDGTADAVLTDADGDHVTDFGRFDTDHDGHFDTVAVDADRDGDADILLVDTDKDGFADTTKASIDEDFEPFSLERTGHDAAYTPSDEIADTEQTEPEQTETDEPTAPETEATDAATTEPATTLSPGQATDPFDVGAYAAEAGDESAPTREIYPSAAAEQAPQGEQAPETTEQESDLAGWIDNTLSGLFR